MLKAKGSDALHVDLSGLMVPATCPPPLAGARLTSFTTPFTALMEAPAAGLTSRLPSTETNFTPTQRLLILDAWRKSGLPAGDFAPLVGIVGAVIAGWLLPRIGFVLIGGIGAAILNAVIGAVILLLIIGFFQRKTA